MVLRVVLLASALLASVPAQAEIIQLTAAQARAAAADALARGDALAAAQIAAAVVAERPDDADALAFLAAAELKLQLFEPAGRHARAAFAKAGTNRRLRHETARMAAMAASRQNRQGVAKFWLRRASDYAENPGVAARTAREFQLVDRLDRWDRQFSFSIAPSSNLNGGSSTDTLTIDGVPGTGILSGDAQALSGLRATVTARLGYRLFESDRSATIAQLHAYTSLNRLSSEAQALAPTAKASDYNFTILGADLIHRFGLPGSRGPFEISVGATKRWYGGEPLSHTAALRFGKITPLGKRAVINNRIELERELADSARSVDATRLTYSAALNTRLAAGAQFSPAVAITANEAVGSYSDYTSASLSMRYAPKPGNGAVQWSASFSYGYRFYPDHVAGLSVVPGGRKDTTIAAGVDLVFSRVQVMGFSPVVTLRAARTNSNVSRYDTTDLSAGLSIRSAF